MDHTTIQANTVIKNALAEIADFYRYTENKHTISHRTRT